MTLAPSRVVYDAAVQMRPRVGRVLGLRCHGHDHIDHPNKDGCLASIGPFVFVVLVGKGDPNCQH